MRFISRVSVPGWMDGPAVAVVNLTPELIVQLKQHRDTLKTILAGASNGSEVHGLTFHEYSAKYYETCPDTWNAEDIDTFAVDDGPLPAETVESTRTEFDLLTVTEHGFYWSAWLKYSNVPVETHQVPWERIEQETVLEPSSSPAEERVRQ